MDSKPSKQVISFYIIVTFLVFCGFSSAEARPDLYVSGVAGGSPARAIVNGKMVKEGDIIAGAEVVSIKGDAVVFRYLGEEFSLSAGYHSFEEGNASLQPLESTSANTRPPQSASPAVNPSDTSYVRETVKAALVDELKYFLYIPKGIDADKKYPLVIALSPSADAIGMIYAWKNVSDKYKWIIFASKEYHNGGDMQKMIDDIASIASNEISVRFPIDVSKIIATGLSGGAMGSHAFAFSYPRLISAIVLNTGMMHEYFLAQKEKYPRDKIAVFLASPTDFRYGAMKQNREFLEGLGWKIKWIEFQGGHTMAPASVYDEAAGWLQENLR